MVTSSNKKGQERFITLVIVIVISLTMLFIILHYTTRQTSNAYEIIGDFMSCGSATGGKGKCTTREECDEIGGTPLEGVGCPPDKEKIGKRLEEEGVKKEKIEELLRDVAKSRYCCVKPR